MKYFATSRVMQFILQYFPPPHSLPALSSSKVDEVVELFEESEVSTVRTHVVAQWSSSNVDTIGTTAVCRKSRGVHILYSASRHDNAYSYC